jgi:late competence protein required for DNA uptake (superfamily II DNA/RNA helicase)
MPDAPQAVRGLYEGSSGRSDAVSTKVDSTEKIEEPKKSATIRQEHVRCSTCGRAYPPEPMVDGRCFYCRKGITLNK